MRISQKLFIIRIAIIIKVALTPQVNSHQIICLTKENHIWKWQEDSKQWCSSLNSSNKPRTNITCKICLAQLLHLMTHKRTCFYNLSFIKEKLTARQVWVLAWTACTIRSLIHQLWITWWALLWCLFPLVHLLCKQMMVTNYLWVAHLSNCHQGRNNHRHHNLIRWAQHIVRCKTIWCTVPHSWDHTIRHPTYIVTIPKIVIRIQVQCHLY